MTTEEEGDALLERMNAEVAARAAPLEFVLRPLWALHLVHLLQVAMRNPSLAASPSHDLVARTIIEHVRAYYADAPATLEVLRRGETFGTTKPS